MKQVTLENGALFRCSPKAAVELAMVMQNQRTLTKALNRHHLALKKLASSSSISSASLKELNDILGHPISTMVTWQRPKPSESTEWVKEAMRKYEAANRRGREAKVPLAPQPPKA